MATNNDMLTAKEAFSFMREVLKMTSPEDSLKADKVHFLNEYCKAFQCHIPFQTVRSLSTLPHERHLPTLEDIKEDVMSKIGGRCYYMNIFTLNVLQAIGFNASMVPADVLDIKGCHTCVILSDLTSKGSKHIIDVGAGCPAFRIIPLDFEEISPVYKDSYLRYRFFRQGDTVIRQHSNDHVNGVVFKDYIKDGWFTFFTIHPWQPVDIAYFDDALTEIYTKVIPGVPFLISLRSFAFPRGRFVCIKDTTLLIEDEEGRVVKSYMRSPQEIVDAFARFFPQYPEEMVKVAMTDPNVSFNYNKGL